MRGSRWAESICGNGEIMEGKGHETDASAVAASSSSSSTYVNRGERESDLEIYVVARMRAFGSIGLQGAAAQCLLNQSEKSSICPGAQLTLNCSSGAYPATELDMRRRTTNAGPQSSEVVQTKGRQQKKKNLRAKGRKTTQISFLRLPPTSDMIAVPNKWRLNQELLFRCHGMGTDTFMGNPGQKRRESAVERRLEDQQTRVS
ncbi:hypothetical protein V8F20_007392 [Naviculisporaceae sp. PSN 640]